MVVIIIATVMENPYTDSIFSEVLKYKTMPIHPIHNSVFRLGI